MNEDVWTVKRILEWIEDYLAQHGDEKPRASAQWLVSDALGVSKMQLFIDLERPLTADERTILRDYTRRRAMGEPLQYITGTVDFRHITVKVRQGVLIPRPETEVLVSEALAMLPAAEKPQGAIDRETLEQLAELGEIDAEDLPSVTVGDNLLVADICTGTGCIACSIAYEHPNTHVVATDISPVAVALARENVDDLKLSERVEVMECDLGSAIDATLIGAFDLVVSNPPYVPTSILSEIPREVADFEPDLALDGGDDGLDVYRRLLEWCTTALKPGGGFAFELHETCLDIASALAHTAGFTDIRITCDLASRPRVITGRKKLLSD